MDELIDEIIAIIRLNANDSECKVQIKQLIKDWRREMKEASPKLEDYENYK